MKEQIIYSTPSLYRDEFRVRAYTFGSGEKSLCIVGSVRGNEFQQIFMASQLVKHIKELEEQGRLVRGKQIMVIPTLNPSSMNIGKKFWPIDNTDINRMFPGYSLGETTQRIAGGVFEIINKYSNGIQFSSFYMPGSFMPHVRIMQTGFENIEKARTFGMEHIVIRDPRPYDTTTLNYNWQIWETDAYTLYSRTTNRLDMESAEDIIKAVDRFMEANGLITESTAGPGAAPEDIKVIQDSTLEAIRCTAAGLYEYTVQPGDIVKKGDVCGRIYNTINGEILEELTAPVDGLVYFQQDEPVIYAHTAAVKVLPQ